MSLSPPSLLPAFPPDRLPSQVLTGDAAFAALRATWQPVAMAANLPPGKTMGYTLLDTELVVSRFADGRLLAANPACPHQGARLAAGCIRAGELAGAYHGWRFNAAGECLSIPSLVEPNPEKLALSHLRTGCSRRTGKCASCRCRAKCRSIRRAEAGACSSCRATRWPRRFRNNFGAGCSPARSHNPVSQNHVLLLPPSFHRQFNAR